MSAHTITSACVGDGTEVLLMMTLDNDEGDSVDQCVCHRTK